MAMVSIVRNEETGQALVRVWRTGAGGHRQDVGSVVVDDDKASILEAVRFFGDELKKIRAREREARDDSYVQLRLFKEAQDGKSR